MHAICQRILCYETARSPARNRDANKVEVFDVHATAFDGAGQSTDIQCNNYRCYMMTGTLMTLSQRERANFVGKSSQNQEWRFERR